MNQYQNENLSSLWRVAWAARDHSRLFAQLRKDPKNPELQKQLVAAETLLNEKINAALARMKTEDDSSDDCFYAVASPPEFIAWDLIREHDGGRVYFNYRTYDFDEALPDDEGELIDSYFPGDDCEALYRINRSRGMTVEQAYDATLGTMAEAILLNMKPDKW